MNNPSIKRGQRSERYISYLKDTKNRRMKVAIILCLLVAGSQANFFDDLKTSLSGVGSAFTDTFHQVGEQAKNVGSQLLETAKQQGTQLASQALQSLLMGTMNALSGSGSSSSKRDLSTLINQASQLEQIAHSFITDKTNSLKNVYTDAISKLQELAKSPNAQNVISQVDNIVHGHTALSNTLKQDIVTGVTNMLQQAFHKDDARRSAFTDKIHEALSQFNLNLDNVYGHFINQAQTVVQQLGEKIVAQALTPA